MRPTRSAIGRPPGTVKVLASKLRAALLPEKSLSPFGNGFILFPSTGSLARFSISKFFELLTIFSSAQVIHGHTLVGDFFEGAVSMSIVESRSPVGRLVALDLARGA